MAVTGRPRAFDRDEALDAAMRLFWRKGYQTASMNDLCEAMHIRSPSLYAAFGSKEALYLEAMAHYGRTVGASLWDRVERAATARDGVAELLRSAAGLLPGCAGGPQGCMAMLAAVSDDWPAALTEAARQIRADSMARLHARLEAAVDGGELPPATDIDGLARLYLRTF